ncbi:hypothetical protein FACS18949_15790 [Clostridia bacterium]|nr:hypothetical protein FACS18949_15790 [Clostridia bacterium]
MKRKQCLAIAIVFCMVLTSAAFPALATVGTPVPVDADGNPITYTAPPESGISTYSYNSNFNLAFGYSMVWTLDFDNRHTTLFIPTNHSRLEIYYTSNYPGNTTSVVNVELYKKTQDSPVQYSPINSIGTYSFNMHRDDAVYIDLPDGNTARDYRLVFTNQDPAVGSGIFLVRTRP